MPSSHLPARPNLEQLNKLAKDLPKAYRAGDSPALRLFRGERPFYLLPLAGVLADVLENLTIAALALTHDGTPSSLAWRRVHPSQDCAGRGDSGSDVPWSGALAADAQEAGR